MFHKFLLIPVLVVIAGFFINSESAMARSSGHGAHASGSHASVSHGGAVSRGGHGNYGRGGYGYGRGGYGYGRGGYYGYGQGGYGYGGYWGGLGWWPGSYWDWPGYYYDGPNYYGTPAYPYGPAVVPYINPLPTPVSTEADIHVLVPDPAARVWFDGALTQETGTDRQFHTPPLTTSGTYHIKAVWTQNGHQEAQEQDVSVSPGQAVTVDFAHSLVSMPR